MQPHKSLNDLGPFQGEIHYKQIQLLSHILSHMQEHAGGRLQHSLRHNLYQGMTAGHPHIHTGHMCKLEVGEMNTDQFPNNVCLFHGIFQAASFS